MHKTRLIGNYLLCLLVFVCFTLNARGGKSPKVPTTSAGQATSVSPRYAVIDLGPNLTYPTKITDSGYIIGFQFITNARQGIYYVWHNGTLLTLQPSDSSISAYFSRFWSATDIAEDGTVVGLEDVSTTDNVGTPSYLSYGVATGSPFAGFITDLAVWSAGSTTPTLTAPAVWPAGLTDDDDDGDYNPPEVSGYVGFADFSPQSNGNPLIDSVPNNSPNIWSDQFIYSAHGAVTYDAPGGVFAGFENQTKLGSDVTIGPLGLNGTDVIPMSVNSSDQCLEEKEFYTGKSTSKTTAYYLGDSQVPINPSVVNRPLSNVSQPIGNGTSGKTYVLGANSDNTLFYCWDGTNLISLPQAGNGSTGFDPIAVNAATTSITVPSTGTNTPTTQVVAATQVIGAITVNVGIPNGVYGGGYDLFGYIWNTVPSTNSPPIFGNPQKLDSLVSGYGTPNPAWSQIWGTDINDEGAIVGAAKYTQQSPTDPIPAGQHGVMLLPIKINFAKPHDATWAELPEKEVLLFEDETHIDVKIPMALTSLTQIMAIPELSKIHLTTNVTKPGGVDLPITFANTAFLTGTDPSTGQPNCELRIVLQRTDVQNLGLLPTNDEDSIDEKTWYDWGSQDTTSTHNLTDSLAFDAASPAVSLGQCTSYGHLGDQPPKKPNSPLDKTYLQAAGREVLTASIGGLASRPRAIAHQADTFYISAEGHIATGLIDTDGPNSDSVTFGASDAEWTHSLKTVVIGGCSVLNIKGYRSSEMTWGDYGKYQVITVGAGYLTSPPSPGEVWEPTGPKYLLGYAFHAPTDIEGAATIASTYETLVAGGMNPIQAWGQANNGTRGNNACAIDVSVSPHQYWYLKRSATSSTGLTWTSVTKTGAGWP